MNKKIGLIIGSIAAVVIVGVGGWWLFLQPKDDTSSAPGQQSDAIYSGAKDACNYLTGEIAAQLLGQGAEKGTMTPMVTGNDVSVSTCIYNSKVGDSLEDIKNMRTATLLVRAPLNATGAESNEVPFKQLKAGAITLEGYGEKAFWDPELGQMNVLKGGTWLIMSLGKSTVVEKSLDETKQLANAILAQF